MRGRWLDWWPDELAWIEETVGWYPTRAAQHAAFQRRFGRDDVPLTAFIGLCKRRGWKTGRSYRFKKGQVSANGFQKGHHTPGCEKGWFRKGNLPHNTRGAGHESLRSDGYIWLIVDEVNPYTGAATRSVQKHRWLWEQANGPVPRGYVLKSLDGDRTNTDPANWVPIPVAMLPRLNSRTGRGYDTAPDELKPIIMATTRLEHAAREARRGKRETHHG